MSYVVIDIAKFNHFATAISSDSELLVEPFKFSNDYDGFYLLLSKLAPLDQHSIIIGLESTAHYGDNLVRFLIRKDFKVCVLNPLSTSAIRKNNLRKTKTDKVDTFVIAKTLMMQDSLRFFTLKDLDYIELKELGRFRQKTVKQRTRLKIQLTSGDSILFQIRSASECCLCSFKRSTFSKRDCFHAYDSSHVSSPNGFPRSFW